MSEQDTHFAHPRGWTEQQLTILKTQWQSDRMSREQVSAIIGKSVEACYDQAVKLGLKKTKTRPWTEAEMELVKRLLAEGQSAAQIGDQIGFTRNAVLGKIHRMGLSNSRPKPMVSEDSKQRKALERMRRFRERKRQAKPPQIASLPIPDIHVVVPESEWAPFPRSSRLQCAAPMAPGLCCGRPVHPSRSYCWDHHNRFTARGR